MAGRSWLCVLLLVEGLSFESLFFSTVAAAAGDPCGGTSVCINDGGATVVITRPGSIPSGGNKPVAAVHRGNTTPIPPKAGNPIRVNADRNRGSTGSRPVRSSASRVSSGPSAAQPVVDAADAQAAGVCAALPGSPCEVSAGIAAAARASTMVPPVTASTSVRPVSAAPAANPVATAPPPSKATPVQAAAQAWTTQPFAAAHVSMQPVGNETLTGLPTYFQATFPGTGLAPGEQVSATVLGQRVTIRPASAQYTYDFGDGTSQGPTPDAGGPYPNGHITHTYEKSATVTVRIDVTLTGEFQVAGGAWEPIPGSTTVRGVPQQLQVEIMQSRLDSDDGTNTEGSGTQTP